MVREGGYVVILCKFFVINFWILAFHSAGFIAMPYPYTFVYRKTRVLKWSIEGFLKDVSQFSVVAKSPGKHSDGLPRHYESRLGDVACRSRTNGALVSSVLWRTKTLTKTRKIRAFAEVWEKRLFTQCNCTAVHTRARKNFGSIRGSFTISVVVLENSQEVYGWRKTLFVFKWHYEK